MPKYKVIFRLMRAFVHSGVLLCMFWVMYLIRLKTDLIPKVHIGIPQINTFELTMFAVIAVIVFFFLGIYNGYYQLHVLFAKNVKKLFSVRLYWVIAMTFLAYFGDGYLFIDGLSRLVWLWTALGSLFAILVVDMVWLWLERLIEKRHPSSLLFVYTNHEELDHVQSAMGINFYQRIDQVLVDTFAHTSLDAYDSVILVGSLKKEILQNIFDCVRIAGKRFYHIASNFFLEDVVYSPDRFGSIMAFEYKPSQLDGWAVVVKRAFDVLGSFLGIIVLSPIFVILAILIKLDTSGPVFYVQQRVGRNAKLFTFVKFRTMYTHLCVGEKYGGEKAQKYRDTLKNSEANMRKGELSKIANDPRITRFGKFLRSTSLDELPNLFSILIGDMSLVGPRPHLPSEIAKYKPWQKRLLSIKPGMTGYAQIKGRDTLTFDQEAHYDLSYIQQWTFLLDISILLKTAKVMFLSKLR